MQPLLQILGISKQFPGVTALSDVSFDVMHGEVHVLTGETGAGKSTLMKIISGVYTHDTGEIIFKGMPVRFSTPQQAQNAGIASVYKERSLIPYLSVTENIFLGSEIRRGGLMDWGKMHEHTRHWLAKLHLDIDPRTTIHKLNTAQQQIVEIAKAFHFHAELIVMDEPTSVLSPPEIDHLFAVIHELKANHIAIIYISKQPQHCRAISDRVSVLNQGRCLAAVHPSQSTASMG